MSSLQDRWNKIWDAINNPNHITGTYEQRIESKRDEIVSLAEDAATIAASEGRGGFFSKVRGILTRSRGNPSRAQSTELLFETKKYLDKRSNDPRYKNIHPDVWDEYK